ncbi:MAG TPA: hypothetical protein VLO29_08275 [Salegentibacter sp.]|nr:hypothetical protein [Salegentibacter sp.]
MKSILFAACAFVSVFLIFFVIQSLGTFKYSNDSGSDFDSENKIFPVLSIVYTPPLGSPIQTDGKNKNFLSPEGPYLDFSEKMPYFQQAILDRKYLPLQVALPLSLIFYFIMSSRSSNSELNI